MKKKLVIPLVLIMAAIMFSQCKTCNCGYQPKKAAVSRPWIKH